MKLTNQILKDLKEYNVNEDVAKEALKNLTALAKFLKDKDVLMRVTNKLTKNADSQEIKNFSKAIEKTFQFIDRFA